VLQFRWHQRGREPGGLFCCEGPATLPRDAALALEAWGVDPGAGPLELLACRVWPGLGPAGGGLGTWAMLRRWPRSIGPLAVEESLSYARLAVWGEALDLLRPGVPGLRLSGEETNAKGRP
jgi:hypothetical protein